jgi:hypothetical protein
VNDIARGVASAAAISVVGSDGALRESLALALAGRLVAAGAVRWLPLNRHHLYGHGLAARRGILGDAVLVVLAAGLYLRNRERLRLSRANLTTIDGSPAE